MLFASCHIHNAPPSELEEATVRRRGERTPFLSSCGGERVTVRFPLSTAPSARSDQTARPAVPSGLKPRRATCCVAR